MTNLVGTWRQLARLGAAAVVFLWLPLAAFAANATYFPAMDSDCGMSQQSGLDDSACALHCAIRASAKCPDCREATFGTHTVVAVPPVNDHQPLASMRLFFIRLDLPVGHHAVVATANAPPLLPRFILFGNFRS